MQILDKIKEKINSYKEAKLVAQLIKNQFVSEATLWSLTQKTSCQKLRQHNLPKTPTLWLYAFENVVWNKQGINHALWNLLKDEPDFSTDFWEIMNNMLEQYLKLSKKQSQAAREKNQRSIIDYNIKMEQLRGRVCEKLHLDRQFEHLLRNFCLTASIMDLTVKVSAEVVLFTHFLQETYEKQKMYVANGYATEPSLDFFLSKGLVGLSFIERILNMSTEEEQWLLDRVFKNEKAFNIKDFILQKRKQYLSQNLKTDLEFKPQKKNLL